MERLARRRDVLLAGMLVMSGALAGCRRQSPGVPVDPALLMLVPADATVMAGVRLDEVKKTPLYARYIANQSLPGLEAFTKRTGLDPRRDLYELIFTGDGRDPLVLARGRFGAAGGLEPRLEGLEGEVQRFRYKTYTLIGREEAAVVFMNTSVAVAGRADALRRVIDGRDRATLGVPERLRQRLEGVSRDNQLWAVGVTDGRALSLPNAPRDGVAAEMAGNLARLIGSVTAFTVAADARQGMRVAANADCATPADAKRLHDSLRGLLGFARLSTPTERRELLEAYDRVTVSLTGSAVKLQADVPDPLLDTLLRTATGLLAP